MALSDNARPDSELADRLSPDSTLTDRLSPDKGYSDEFELHSTYMLDVMDVGVMNPVPSG